MRQFFLMLMVLALVAPSRSLGQPLAPKNEPGYLGLVADDRQENGRGIRVVEIVRGGPADQAGLQAGDLITTIGAAPLRNMNEFTAWLNATPAQTRVAIDFERAGRRQQTQVTLAPRPAAGADRRFPEFGKIPAAAGGGVRIADPAIRPTLGVQCEPVTDALRRGWGLPLGESGAFVTNVANNSPAAAAGIKVGDVIVAFAGRRVRSPEDLAAAVQQSPLQQELDVLLSERGQLIPKKVVLVDAAALAAAAPRKAVPEPPAPGGYSPPPSGPPQPSRPDTAPIGPFAAQKPADEPSRVEVLEKRVADLEQRIVELEKLLRARPSP